MAKRTRYLNKLHMYMMRSELKVITGIRRSGKTTLMKQFIDELISDGVPEENIIYLNFEAMAIANFRKAGDLRAMLIDFVNGASGKAHILLDEVCEVAGWAEVASEMMNLFGADVYVSSSNASIFGGDFQKFFGLRYVRIDVYPLSYGEYLEAALSEDKKASGRVSAGELPAENEKSAMDEADAAEARGSSGREKFLAYLEKGFMPGSLRFEDEASRNDYLSGVYSTIILNDVVKANRLRDAGHIEKIMEYVLSHEGEAFSPKAVRDYVSALGTVISVDTVYSVLDALTGAYILYKVPRYDVKAERVLDTKEKYYLCDPAMRDAVYMGDPLSLERKLESAVALEMLSRGFRLYTAKSGKTLIDFMAVRGGDRTYLNVAESVEDPKTQRREFGSLARIRDNYFKMVLSLDESTLVNMGGIINFPVMDFLAE